jgi:type I site-specific restriction endonuclease
MRPLHLPPYSYNINSKNEIFDRVRRKFVALTPEEWVRQHLINYLITEKNVPASLLAVEKSLQLNNLTKRADIVVYSKNGKALMLVECKAPEVKITQTTFEQIARYNMVHLVNYLLVSNGLEHYCALVDFSKRKVDFLHEIPDYDQLIAG